jgi:starch synthase (maltosyl-transferring)
MAEPRSARVVIEAVIPEIDCGRFPIKRTEGEEVVVEADAFGDGHELVACELLHRSEADDTWTVVRMEPLDNDRFRGSFRVALLGRHFYTVRAWIDGFGSWSRDLGERRRAGQDVDLDLRIGAGIVSAAAKRATGADARELAGHAELLEGGGDGAQALALSADLAALIDRYPDVADAAAYGRELTVVVDRERARFGAWYEMFPRSAASKPGRHGSLKDCETLLPGIAAMGFDVLYLPPIHPIGRTHRKGRNNFPAASKEEPGSPWAIGGPEGGHTAIHPELGTLEDFRRLVARAADLGLEIALDVAFQCTPDHPWVREHPEWFRRRPDGAIQHAENPPKKYEDIYPLDFETDDWRALWEELKSVVFFWAEQGVRIFRVDNPHTKPFAFWEWLIGEVKRSFPETIFLSEAFTRPKVMYRLAKLGFTQSYTYFAWRNTATEITDYFRELTSPPVCEFFRANLWPNTPDILTEYLQLGDRAAFVTRLILAATLGASYGIYGPAFELCERIPREAGSEEYRDSEKYEIRLWERERPDSLKNLIECVNGIRRDNPALQSDRRLRFHPSDNSQLLCYSKTTEGYDNVVLMAVNLDPHHTQAGWVELDTAELGIAFAETYQVHDLISGARYLWSGARNYVELDPRVSPAHVLRVRRHVRTERDFDYFL